MLRKTLELKAEHRVVPNVSNYGSAVVELSKDDFFIEQRATVWNLVFAISHMQ